MRRLLLLDDEPNILNALRRCFATLIAQDDFADVVVEYFTSVAQALERVEEEDFDLVMCDYRMPEMNGVAFLARVIEIQPHVGRMIMSGYADRDAILSAINEVQVARFVCKPWDDAELRRIIANALDARGVPAAPKQAPSEHRQRILQRMESECPGITHVDRAEDGSINLFFE